MLQSGANTGIESGQWQPLNEPAKHSQQLHFQSFFEQTGTYNKPTKVPPWLAVISKIFKICASRCFENALPGPVCS